MLTMIAVIAAIAEKKSSAIAAIIRKPLSSDRSNRWDEKSSISVIVAAICSCKAEVIFSNRFRKFSCKQFELFKVRIVKGTRSNIFTCKFCAWVIFIILFTGLLCDNSNSLTYEPRKGQSATLSSANSVIVNLMLAFHSNNSNLSV